MIQTLNVTSNNDPDTKYNIIRVWVGNIWHFLGFLGNKRGPHFNYMCYMCIHWVFKRLLGIITRY